MLIVCPQRSPSQCGVAPIPGPCVRSVEAAGTGDPRVRPASRGPFGRYWEGGLQARAPEVGCQALGPDAQICLPAFQGKDPTTFSHMDDPRQCALCLKYGDADSKVRATVCVKPQRWVVVLSVLTHTHPTHPLLPAGSRAAPVHWAE